MRTVMQFLLVVLALASTGVHAQTVPVRGEITSRPVREFSARGVPMLDALLQLGRETDVPLGIEYIDLHALRQPVSVALRDTTFGQVLDSILQYGQGYAWSTQNGVALIRNQKLPLAPSLNLFEFVIGKYTLPRPATLAEASMLLYMELDVRIHGTKGFAGSYNPGDVRGKIDPLRLTNKTVGEILNTILGNRKHAAWIATAPPEKLGNLQASGLWRIVEYSDPMRSYASELGQLPQFQYDFLNWKLD